MKTYRILERRGTWIALMFSVLLAPVIALAFPRVPFDGFQKISNNAQRMAQQQSRPDATAQFQKLLDTSTLPNPEKLRQLAMLQLESPEFFYLEPIRAIVTHAETMYGTWVHDYAALAQTAQMQPGLIRPTAGATNNGVQTVASMQQVRRLSAEFACLAIANGETTAALQNIEELSRADDPVAAGSWGSIYDRRKAYELSEELLHRVDSVATSQALATLDNISMRDMNPLLSVSNLAQVEAANLERRWEWMIAKSFLAQQLIQDAAWSLAIDRNHFRRPENQAWASDLLALTDIRYAAIAGNPLLLGGAKAMRPWTELPAMWSRIRHIARTESNLLPDRLKTTSLMEGVDRDLATLFLYGYVQHQGGEMYTIARAYETYRLALKAAFAAREFHKVHERWPANIQELVAEYAGVSAAIAVTSSTADTAEVLVSAGKHPYGPLRIELTTVTNENAPRLLGLAPAITMNSDSNLHNCIFTCSGRRRYAQPGHFTDQLLVQQNGYATDLGPLEVYALAEKLKTISALKNVRVTGRDQDVWRVYDALATRRPELRTLAEDAGSSVPMSSPENYYVGPNQGLAITADIDMPDGVFTIKLDNMNKDDYPNGSRLRLSNVMGTVPGGNLLVCPMAWSNPDDVAAVPGAVAK